MGILIKPIVTEKLTVQGEKLNRYGFIVDREANKLQIKAAVEQAYNVTVADVNTVNYHIVELLNRSLDLKFVSLAVNNKSVTVQLFALNRQLLSYYWLNYNSHLSICLSSDSRSEDILNAINKYE